LPWGTTFSQLTPEQQAEEERKSYLALDEEEKARIASLTRDFLAYLAEPGDKTWAELMAEEMRELDEALLELSLRTMRRNEQELKEASPGVAHWAQTLYDLHYEPWVDRDALMAECIGLAQRDAAAADAAFERLGYADAQAPRDSAQFRAAVLKDAVGLPFAPEWFRLADKLDALLAEERCTREHPRDELPLTLRDIVCTRSQQE